MIPGLPNDIYARVLHPGRYTPAQKENLFLSKRNLKLSIANRPLEPGEKVYRLVDVDENGDFVWVNVTNSFYPQEVTS